MREFALNEIAEYEMWGTHFRHQGNWLLSAGYTGSGAELHKYAYDCFERAENLRILAAGATHASIEADTPNEEGEQ